MWKNWGCFYSGCATTERGGFNTAHYSHFLWVGYGKIPLWVFKTAYEVGQRVFDRIHRVGVSVLTTKKKGRFGFCILGSPEGVLLGIPPRGVYTEKKTKSVNQNFTMVCKELDLGM